MPKDSPARSISDLAGKRIAVANGSSANYLLVKALAQEGLTPSDIEPAFLPPAAARAAFDAWATWDPFLAAAQEATQARVLRDGSGLARNRQVYVTSRSFAERHPDLVQTVLAEFDAADRWPLRIGTRRRSCCRRAPAFRSTR